jgi:hypothetical protein
LDKQRIESITQKDAFYERKVVLGLLELLDQNLFTDIVWLRAAFGRSKLAKKLDNNHGIDIIVVRSSEKLALPIQVKVTEPQAVKFQRLYPHNNIPVIITRSLRWYKLYAERQNAEEAIQKRVIRQAKHILATVDPDWWKPEYYKHYLQIENACRIGA